MLHACVGLATCLAFIAVIGGAVHVYEKSETSQVATSLGQNYSNILDSYSELFNKYTRYFADLNSSLWWLHGQNMLENNIQITNVSNMLQTETSRAMSVESGIAAELFVETSRAIRRESALAASATFETSRVSFLRLADINRTLTTETSIYTEMLTIKAAASAAFINFTSFQLFVMEQIAQLKTEANATYTKLKTLEKCVSEICV